jgi:hypothetical protein
MPTLTVSVLNASREPIPDRFDLEIQSVRTLRVVHRSQNVSGGSPIAVSGLSETEPLVVRVFPFRHRPVGVPAPVLFSDQSLSVHCPLIPDRADGEFPAWDDLDEALRQVLEKSSLEGDTSGTTGEALYSPLEDLLKAGLLNLYTKLSLTGLPVGRTAWDFVTDVYRIRPDRIFANVELGYRDAFRAAEEAKLVKSAPDNQHTPPPGFSRAGSFKTPDRTGNLQVTFFSKDAELQFKVDTDIDDANGLAHAFQVLEHALTGRDTHPYDIHQILTFDQRIPMPYVLTPWQEEIPPSRRAGSVPARHKRGAKRPTGRRRTQKPR